VLTRIDPSSWPSGVCTIVSARPCHHRDGVIVRLTAVLQILDLRQRDQRRVAHQVERGAVIEVGV